jgi:simple sugar transport system ATP-binding protein
MLELRSLTRQFGSFTALGDVNFAIRPGEIVGLLGENGAGKSTLISIVGGELAPSSGEVRWDGAPLQMASARDAAARGIGVVHQHFRLVPVFTVAENLALAAGEKQFRFDARAWQQRAEAWAASLDWRVDGAARIEDLSVGERQRVEILKALFAGNTLAQGSMNGTTARLLLLDEPTANLTPHEADELFQVLRKLRDQGCAIIFVSHKLNEVLEFCDRVVVLRRGKVVGERAIDQTNSHDLAALMVGRELENAVLSTAPDTATGATEAPVLLQIEGLSCGQLRDFSLQVCSGQIVGLAGVDGNGQSELFEALSGLRKADSGHFIVSNGGSNSAISFIPPDRHREGLILPFDLAENIALSESVRAAHGHPLFFDWKAARERTRALIEQFDIRTPATAERTPAASLSGGNQQKVVIARALSFGARVVVAVDPARGLDVGAARFVHRQLVDAAQNGAAVLLISTDLDEIMQLSHSIGVLYEGRLLPGPELLPHGTSRETIGALMGGIPVGSDTVSTTERPAGARL